MGHRQHIPARARRRRIVDLRVVAPLRIFGNDPGFLQFPEALEIGEVAGRLGGIPGRPREIVELETRGGQLRIEIGRGFELLLRIAETVRLAVEQSKLKMCDRFAGHTRNHAFELRDGTIRIALVFVIDPEIEPGMRQRGILALNVFEQLDRLLFVPTSAQQGECVVQLLPRGIRGDSERLLEFGYGPLLRGGIFVKRFAEVAMPGQRSIIAAGMGTGG